MTRGKIKEDVLKYSRSKIDVEIPDKEKASRNDYLIFKTRLSNNLARIDRELKEILDEVSDELYREYIIKVGGKIEWFSRFYD